MTTSLKLFANPNSPFALKVQILARELGLFARLEIDESVVANPTAHSTSHSALVPNGKLPALIVNGDTPIYGSEIICQYLVSIADRKPTGYVDAGLTKFEQATTEALAGSIMDAALLMRYERLSRPENLRWEDWITGQRSKITRSIPVLANRKLADPSVEVLGPDSVAAAIALWYLDKRAPDAAWRTLDGGAKLEAWMLKIQARPSWTETKFGM